MLELVHRDFEPIIIHCYDYISYVEKLNRDGEDTKKIPNWTSGDKNSKV